MRNFHFKLNENSKALLNIATAMIAMFVNICVGFFLSPYIVKHLGVEANGFIQLATNFTMYAGLITSALNSMGGRFISLSYHKGDVETASSYYSSMVYANIIIAFFLLIPAVLFVVFINSIIKITPSLLQDAKILFSLVFVTFFITQFISLININLFVSNKLYIHNAINSVRHFLKGVLLLFMFAFFPAKMFFTTLTSASLSFVLIFIYVFLKAKILPEIRYKQSLVHIKRIVVLVKSGIWNTVNQGGNILLTGFDLIIANLFIDSIQMGILATAKVIPSIIVSIGTQLNSSLSPRMVISYAKSNKNELLSQIDFAARLSIFFLIIPISLFAVYGQDFYHLWIPSLDSQRLWITSILTLLTFIPLAGTQTLFNVLTSMNKLSYNSILFFSSGVLNIIVVYFTLKTTNLGIFAIAGVSSLLSIIRNLVFMLPYIASLLKIKSYQLYRFVFLALWCTLITGAFAFAIRYLLTSTTWLSLIFSVFVSMVIVVVVNFYIILKKQERERVLSIITKRGKNEKK